MAGVPRASSIHVLDRLLFLGLALGVGCGQAKGGSEKDVPGSVGGRSAAGDSASGGTSTAPPSGGVSGELARGGSGASEAGRAAASAGESSSATGGAATGGAATGGASSSGGSVGAEAGAAGTGGGVSGEGGSGGEGAPDPYAPRSGRFRMLVYSRTTAYRPASISDGQEMLQEIGSEQGFELTLTESKEDINPENLAAHEVVLFLHTTGDVLDAAQQEAFGDWMVKSAGAFVGIGHAVDAEANWGFYKELTGQYIDNMTPCCPEADVTWTPEALEFPAVQGLPSPWRIGGLWFFMSHAAEWSQKPGFKILGTITVSRGDLVVLENPVSFVREFDRFRSFYAGFGHQSADFQDANVRKHLTAGILWTVRREHLVR